MPAARPTARAIGSLPTKGPGLDRPTSRAVANLLAVDDAAVAAGAKAVDVITAGKRWSKDREMALERSIGARRDAVGGGGHGEGPIIRLAAPGRQRATKKV